MHTWQECVVERNATDSFKVWDNSFKVGNTEVDSYSHGRNEDGSMMDDSVMEEWSLALGPVPDD
eukprot:5303999-Pleurochrysis_carterae.AAC.1